MKTRTVSCEHDCSTTLPTLSTPDPMRTVAEGETLRSICRSWYGNPALANALATYNNLPDPDRLAPGLRLIMPQCRRTRRIGPNPWSPWGLPSNRTQRWSWGPYTVQSGDTLSEIAQKLMGTARATASLYELNRGVLPDMNALRVGMVLQYPSLELNPGHVCETDVHHPCRCSHFAGRPCLQTVTDRNHQCNDRRTPQHALAAEGRLADPMSTG